VLADIHPLVQDADDLDLAVWQFVVDAQVVPRSDPPLTVYSPTRS